MPDKETVFAVPEFYVLTMGEGPDATLYSHRRYATLDDAKRYIRAGYENYLFASRATWRHRDEIEAAEGLSHYRDPVWATQDWWQEASELLAPLDPKISLKDPKFLAYYQTPEKACRGIRTMIRPGRFLGKYFPDMPEKERARMARWQETGSLETEFTDEARYPLAFADTPDAIENVYVHGPNSCMSGEADSEFSTDGIHPCRVYGAGDLAIAYLTEQATGRIRARALCRPAHKVFGRVYPTPDGYWRTDGFASPDEAKSMQDALTNRLLGLGYKQGDSDCFDGAKLLKIQCDNGWVMPYLDWSYGVIDRGEYWCMSLDNYDIKCDSTSGYIEDNSTVCDHCDERVDATTDVATGTYSSGAPRNFQQWCSCCVDSDAFRCEGMGDYFSDHIESVEVDGHTYTLAYAETYFRRSDRSDEWFSGDYVRMANGDMWSQDEADEFGFCCDITGDYYDLGDRRADIPDHDIGPDATDEQIAEYLGCDISELPGRINAVEQLELSTQEG